jgi:hypothetical protein
MDETASVEESYHNSYYYFIRAVKILSESPEKQCELVGNYNVAWELKDEVTSGLYLIESPASTLSSSQKLAIQQLIDELNKIPANVLREVTSHENNLKAMQSPVWEPLRKQAAILQRTLESATKNNEQYFS